MRSSHREEGFRGEGFEFRLVPAPGECSGLLGLSVLAGLVLFQPRELKGIRSLGSPAGCV